MTTGTTNAGADPIRPSALPWLVGFLVLILLTGPVPAAPGDKGKKAEEPYALIAGTVFQESGFVLRGAEVTVTPDTGTAPPAKMKKRKAVSDGRGEFAIRVPVVPMRYTVSVRASGFRPQEKQATIAGDERVDLFFRLEPETK